MLSILNIQDVTSRKIRERLLWLENSFYQRNTWELSSTKQWQLPGYRSAMTHVSLTYTHTHAQPGGDSRLLGPKEQKSVHLFCWVTTNMTSDALLAGSRPIVKVISLIKEVLIIPQLFGTWLSETLTLLPAQEPHLICPSCVILCIALSFHVQHAISAMNEIELQQLKMRAKSICVFPVMG